MIIIIFESFKGSTNDENGNRIGGLVSRYMSNIVTGGDSSEKLPKEFRRPLSSEAKIEEFSQFSIPDSSHLQVYLRKYPNFRESNTPFHLFEPSPEELEENELIQRQRKEAKEENLRRRNEEKKTGRKPTRKTKGRSIVFQGVPDSSSNSNEGEAGPSGVGRGHESIEEALDAAEAEGQDQESVDVEDEDEEDPFILEYIENQIEENDDEEFGIYDDRQIEFVDEEEVANDPVYDFLEDDENNDAQYINLVADLPSRRKTKRPSRFDDYDMN